MQRSLLRMAWRRLALVLALSWPLLGCVPGVANESAKCAPQTCGPADPGSSGDPGGPSDPPPTTPAAPVGMMAIRGMGENILRWQDVPNATSYNLYWGTAPGVTPQTGTRIPGVASPYPHAGLTSGTYYYYVATAQTGPAEGAASLQVLATPLAGNSYVYVTDAAGNGIVAVQNLPSSAFPAVPGSPFPAQGTSPTWFATDPAYRYLFVAQELSGDVAAYTIAPGTGALTDVAGPPTSPYPVAGLGPTGMAVTPDGQYLFVADFGSSTVVTFSIGGGGALTNLGTTPTAGSAEFIGIDPLGRFLYVSSQSPMRLDGFRIGPGGVLTPVPGSPYLSPAGTSIPVGVKVDPSGRFVYVAYGSGHVISGYQVDGTTGALTPIAGSPFAVAATGGSYMLGMDPTGTYLYCSGSAGGIAGFPIDPFTGAILARVNSPSLAIGSAGGVALDPLGQLVYLANSSAQGVNAFNLNFANGDLTDAATPSFSTGGASNPNDVIVITR